MQKFQLGSNFIWKQMPYLAWSMRSFSLLRQCLPLPPLTMLACDTPFSHNMAFRNEQQLTYFCPTLNRWSLWANY